MNGSRYGIRTTMLVLCILAALTLPASAGTGDDSDSSSPEVGIEWVCDYTYPYADLPNSDDSAVGFYNRIGNAGWTKKFNKGDSNAKAAHFEQSGSDTTYIDGVDIAFYQGHGSAGKLDVSAYTEKVYANEAEWGDYDLEWIGLHACNTLSNNDFSESLQGAHLICGFSTTAYNYAGDGENWAGYLIDDGANDDAYTVKNAWFYGIDINQPAGVTLKVFGETSTCGNDKIWGQGTVISDPAVDDQFTTWTYNC
ncbi:hypothetical protein MSHOH_0869 [Methanosarcina horonobensis HB-1 = JCM 15518]|uniref:Uncharacterized protein n=1 Tax=Methanosarcina horonobensis HB-1 = JCM 15518 TaxID=1434110 RepID=A0A0E3SBW9_9EURY|nr:DUF6345 domain-containing protein [Methanosarcina horonobensis]AKB77352.1 hypothetical protein MSHOH_0869 [Methanosarcina horonobensis HB-1 = JCM 15518]